MAVLKKILIANRGTAATRIMRCCSKLGIEFVTVYSADDHDSLHVNSESVCLSGTSSEAVDTYLNKEALFKVCADKNCDAIHPGYGFLSEDADFAAQCEERAITFIGPTAEQIYSFGLKDNARSLATKHNVPVLPGTDSLGDVETALAEAKRIGYPVLIKAVAGGGGRGIVVCENDNDLVAGFEAMKKLAQSAFNNDRILLEKFLAKSRHIEVQIFGDGKGNVISLGERDCSTQRRKQKVIEESPAPFLPEKKRKALWDCAVRLLKGVSYRSAGTVEFVVDTETLDFYFLEVNPRVQVEHGVTEQVYTDDGVYELDLIEWMIKASAGELDLSHFILPSPKYHSIQCRIYAENPNENFRPSTGDILTEVTFPKTTPDLRVETWIRVGAKVSPHYDSMLGKLIARGKTREEARLKLIEALNETRISGVECNVEFLEQILATEEFSTFKEGKLSTSWLSTFKYVPKTVDVLKPGTQTSIQDYPGRIGYWAPGVPPSGPMDYLAFRVGNKLVGNPDGAAGLEMTIQGATLKFNCECYIALTGAPMTGDLNGKPIQFWQTLKVSRGSVLTLGHCEVGSRTYLAISGGGFDVPYFLGSKSTFALGKFGGHAGRTLVSGDVLHMFKQPLVVPLPLLKVFKPITYSNGWELRVLMGPHSAPDFFTQEFISTFFSTSWIVHYNSNRLGIRLSGPKPTFARLDGGEAGLHPSNIHDTVYAIGTINFTGDMPVILGLDGPSLGGFVCPATIVKADLWKVGQLRPGDTVKFVLTSFESALQEELCSSTTSRGNP